AGGSATVTLVAHTSSAIAQNSTLTDTANVSSSTADANAANNTATFQTTFTTQADLVTTKTDTPDPVTAGQNITYTVSVTNTGPVGPVTAGTDVTYTIVTTNNGPSDAQNVATSDVLPAGTSLVSFTQNSGPGNGGTLPVGQSETFTLVVHVLSSDANG